MADVASRRPLTLPWIAACVLLALLVRLPVLALPLEGDGARLATRGAVLAGRTATPLEGAEHHGPLVPLLLALPVRAGATPTGALRSLDVLLGAAGAGLAAFAAWRLGLARREAGLVGVLFALHPHLAVHAGGPLASSAGAATALLLGALGLLASPGPRRRRAGAVLAALLPLASPLMTVLGLALLVGWLRRDDSLRARLAVGALFVVCVVFTPWPGLDPASGPGTRVLAFLFQWVPLAGLLGLLAGLPRGASRLFAGESAAWVRLWATGVAACLLLLLAFPLPGTFAFGAGAASAAAPLVPLVLVLGVAGLGALPAPWPKRVRRTALVLATAGALLAVLGAVQTFLLPASPAAAGRLHRLALAVDAAKAAAGPDGWVALDLDARLPAVEVDRLMDRVATRRVGRLPRLGPAGRDAVGVLPVEELEAGRTLGIVTPYRPEVQPVTTLAGTGIYEQAPHARFGPWLVLRARRP